jgi:hypothetical protein
MDPQLRVKDVFKPGGSSQNKCIVDLGATFGRDCLPKQQISAFGVPKTYMSPFAQRAFYSVGTSKLKNYDAFKERVEKNVEEQQLLVTRWEADRLFGKKVVSKADVRAAKFKAVMADQTGFSGDVTDLEDDAEAGILATETAFQQMSMCRHHQISSADKQALKKVVVKWLDMVDNVFKFYAAFDGCDNTSTMSKAEFTSFINGAGIFKDTSSLKDHIDAAFSQANIEDAPSAQSLPQELLRGRPSTFDEHNENPDDELMRFEFIECLVRLSQIRYSSSGVEAERRALLALEAKSRRGSLAHFAKAEEAEDRLSHLRGRATTTDFFACDIPMHVTFERIMTEFVKPSFEAKSTDNEVAVGLRTTEAQALFAIHFHLLMVVYKYYACRDIVAANVAAAMEATGSTIGTMSSSTMSSHSGVGSQGSQSSFGVRAPPPRPTLNLQEFTDLVHDSGLSMTDEDRERLAAQKRKRDERDRRRRFARGIFEEQKEVVDDLSNDLTDVEIRQAFACSQVVYY